MRLRIVVILIYCFLLAPIVIVVLAAFNAGAYLTFPPEGLSLRWFDAFFHSRPFTRAFFFSIELAAVATLLSTLIGTGAAMYVARSRGRLLNLVRILMIAPLPVPGILTGIALLLFFYATGFATKGWPPMIIGHTLICLPYVFLVVSAVLVGLDPSLVEAARNLGAGPLTAFWRVTLPIVKGGVIAGAIFAFITSFDEFNISLLLSGVDTVPLPIQLFDFLRFSFDPTAAVVGTISIAMAFVVVVATERLVGLESLYWGAR
jgi:putative spermidine/putrescine transport system permease protein